MLFSSYPFIFWFLPLSVVGYRLIGAFGNPRWSVAWLATFSYAFYLFGERIHPWLLATSIGLNWVGSILIQRTDGNHRRNFLFAFVLTDILMLGYFKYFNFATSQLREFGLLPGITHNIILPIGISFFTFTQIAFLVDAYRRETKSSSLWVYALFVSFYPHLIAGPILHHKEMVPQFCNPSSAKHLWRDVFAGMGMFAIGLTKKVLIADSAAAVATGMFSSAPQIAPGLAIAWIGMFAYTVQIYFDFSGYSDMAIGISQLMGIKLPINFNAPYKSTSVIEFWRRWHITLSRFLRDYLYFALGGNRRGAIRRYTNLMITMALGGLWHGAGWTFLIWGTMHGSALAIAHLWDNQRRRLFWPRIPPALGWALTFIFVVFAWVPFRAPDVSTTMSVWAGMAGLHGAGIPRVPAFASLAGLLGVQTTAVDYYLGRPVLLLVLGALLLTWLAPTSQEITRRFQLGLDSPGYGARPSRKGGRFILRPTWVCACAAGLLLALAARGIGGYSEFIYFRF